MLVNALAPVFLSNSASNTLLIKTDSSVTSYVEEDTVPVVKSEL